MPNPVWGLKNNINRKINLFFRFLDRFCLCDPLLRPATTASSENWQRLLKDGPKDWRFDTTSRGFWSEIVAVLRPPTKVTP